MVGDPTDPATDIGPLASEEHWQKVCRYFEIAEADGAKLLTGGPHEGWWVRPTVLVNTTQEMRISREEIFGPIVTIAPFDGEADAIRLANDSRYGLNAMVVTENARRARTVSHALCGPAQSGSTATSFATCARRSAASRTAGSAAKEASTAANSSPKPRPS